MSQSNKKQTSEDLMASLMEELKLIDLSDDQQSDSLVLVDSLEPTEDSDDVLSISEDSRTDFGLLDLDFGHSVEKKSESIDINNLVDSSDTFEIKLQDEAYESIKATELHLVPDIEAALSPELIVESEVESYNEKTVAIVSSEIINDNYSESDRTVAVAGYLNRSQQNTGDDNIKISVGQSSGSSSGYGGWGSTDSNLAQAENLKIAQNKILELEKENEKLRYQSEELVSASEIIRERSDLLTAQVYEYKNDRESLENSFKNELALIKSQLNRKDAELLKSQMKIDELDSRLKFDMKKIRIRERELENRLELMRAEKNALVRSKDEQILDSRRKIDQLQLEVDSYRQKCVELNRVLETNQDSFKRTTRALRLAMANLELQEENKIPLKKVD